MQGSPSRCCRTTTREKCAELHGQFQFTRVVERGRAAAGPAEVRQLPARSFQYCVPRRHSKPNKQNMLFPSVNYCRLPPISPSDCFTIGSNYQVRDGFAIPVDQVKKQLGAIKTAEICGPDELPNWILKDIVACVSVHVTSLFNSSLCEGCVPQMWKLADVRPLAKVSFSLHPGEAPIPYLTHPRAIKNLSSSRD